jgi:curved DNA-binding protein CbpA
VPTGVPLAYAHCVADGITWYDVLGVSPGASGDTLRQAYEDRKRQLRAELLNGAPSPVLSAAAKASQSIEAAWLALSDPARRREYDEEIGLHPERGLRGSADFGGSAMSGAGPSYLLPGRLGAMLAGAAMALADWLRPGPPPAPRRRMVPDVRGLFYQPCRDVVTMTGLRLAVVRLTADPMPVEGLVVGQSPAAGSNVKTGSTVTVRVWHPPRRR